MFKEVGYGRLVSHIIVALLYLTLQYIPLSSYADVSVLM